MPSKLLAAFPALGTTMADGCLTRLCRLHTHTNEAVQRRDDVDSLKIHRGTRKDWWPIKDASCRQLRRHTLLVMFLTKIGPRCCQGYIRAYPNSWHIINIECIHVNWLSGTNMNISGFRFQPQTSSACLRKPLLLPFIKSCVSVTVCPPHWDFSKGEGSSVW